MSNKAVALKCTVNNYHWGKVGSDSLVARLALENGAIQSIDANKCYSELWMGTHPQGQSIVMGESGDEGTLFDHIRSFPEKLGNQVEQTFGGDLPFLFKVLSINKALSIQAHPNKEHAKQLHASDPANYPDENHKPEFVLALTSFQALCGFRQVKEILTFVRENEELADVIGQEDVIRLERGILSPIESDQREGIKTGFHALMTAPKELVASAQSQMYKRMKSGLEEDRVFPHHNLGHLFMRLSDDFPGDVGCFAIFFLNHICLQPGEAMFLGPNVPHAYLVGDCVEIMASSNNTVRAGLTPKFVDVETLINMLDFTPTLPEARKHRPAALRDQEDVWGVYFTPPVEEFAMVRIHIPDVNAIYEFPALPSASVVLCMEGVAKCPLYDGTIRAGTVLFMPANVDTQIRILEGPLLLFRAFANV